MSSAIAKLFSDLQLRPVLMDVGGTGEPPPVWSDIAPFSTYVGLGPEASPAGQSLIHKFRHAHTLEKIVTATGAGDVPLHLTKDRVYSSTLQPDPRAIADFVYPDLDPDDELSLPATTLDSLVSSLSLPSIDWLHTNINGTDVPVFQSLNRDLRERVLALDSCLDLVNLYRDQDSGIARYPEFISDGFWLSRSFSSGPVKMRRESVARMQALDPVVNERFLSDHHRRAPGWVFVRFLRTPESLEKRNAPQRDYVLLWTFALLDGQPGFGADLLFAYEQRFGADRLFDVMQTETLRHLKALKPKASTVSIAKKCVPAPVRRGFRRLLRGR